MILSKDEKWPKAKLSNIVHVTALVVARQHHMKKKKTMKPNNMNFNDINLLQYVLNICKGELLWNQNKQI